MATCDFLPSILLARVNFINVCTYICVCLCVNNYVYMEMHACIKINELQWMFVNILQMHTYMLKKL